MRIWTCRQTDQQIARKISTTLDIHPIVSELLVQRGLAGAQEAAAFLRPSLLDLHDPFLFRDMDKAVKRLVKARAAGEKVLVYGDYDVDGVTSTALLFKVLTDLGFKVTLYVPHRQEEGYGLHMEAIEKAIQAGINVLITVDCGISAVEEIAYANRHHIDVILTDHHEPPAELPPAFAVINPKVEGSGYPFKDLAGVGVAFKLVQALFAEFGKLDDHPNAEREILDIVALGTIADVVPLTGENRIIVAHGLKQMEQTVHPGLRALLDECGLAGEIRAIQVAFIVAPRINAPGRLDSAKIGVELLLSDDLDEAREIARILSQENYQRQVIENEILQQAIAALERQPLPRVIVLADERWHHGVIGIVASRLVERYHRPAFLIAIDGEEGKGSARGIPGYHVLEQLTKCQELLTKFGGHRQAAGFSLPAAHIDSFRKRLNACADNLPEDLFFPRVVIDRLVTLDEVTEDLMRDLDLLAPFGYGNHAPVLGSKNIPLYQAAVVGKDGKHLKVRLGERGELEGIAYRQGEKISALKCGELVDLAFALEWNVFQGEKSLQLKIEQIESQAAWNSDDEKTAELAAAWEIPEFIWLDWRNLGREEWLERLCHRENVADDGPPASIWVWDTAHGRDVITLDDFVKDKNGTKREKYLIWTKSQRNQLTNQGNHVAWGVIVGIPLGGDELNRGLKHFARIGITHIIWVEGYVEESVLRKRCGFFTREELVAIYRRLCAHAQRKNPFLWEAAASSPEEREAIKIFEELKLFSCHGGIERLSLQYHRATQKLDLNSSIRFRTGQRLWEQVKKFKKQLDSIPLGKLNDIMNCNIKKGGTWDEF